VRRRAEDGPGRGRTRSEDLSPCPREPRPGVDAQSARSLDLLSFGPSQYRAACSAGVRNPRPDSISSNGSSRSGPESRWQSSRYADRPAEAPTAPFGPPLGLTMTGYALSSLACGCGTRLLGSIMMFSSMRYARRIACRALALGWRAAAFQLPRSQKGSP